MRILLVGHAYPPYLGGLSHVLYNTSIRFVAMGHEVTVLGLRYGGYAPNIDVGRFRVIRVPGIAPRESYFAPTPQFMHKFIELVREFNPDVIHMHNVGSLIIPTAIMMAKALGVSDRVVLTPHYHEEGSRTDTRALWMLYRPVLRRVLRNACRVHTVSNFERTLVLRDFGIDSIVIPNGVDEDVYEVRREDPEGLTVTYAGRVEGYKRVDLAVIAIAQVQRALGVRVALKVIGDGPAMGRVRELAKTYGVELVHTGFLPRREYLRELARSSAFINLSRYEAFSIVTAEALALGLPVIIASPWGRIFENYGAYVVNAEDVSNVAKALTKALTEPINVSVRVPTWSEVVGEYVRKLYNSH